MIFIIKNYNHYRRIILAIIIIFSLSSVLSWHFFMWHASHLNDLYNYQEYILDGRAPWQADINRVLAPLLIRACQNILHVDYSVAYNKFMHVSFFFVTLSTATLCLLSNLKTKDFIFVCSSSAALLTFTFGYWWFSWSALEFSLFTFAFCCDFLKKNKIRLVLLSFLFLLMCLNKETSIFFPLWLMLRKVFSRETILFRLDYSSLKNFFELCWPYLAMIVLSSKITTILRHFLWSGPADAGFVPNAPHFMGNVVEILGPNATYRALNFVKCVYASFTFSKPYPLFGNHHWPDWSAAYIMFSLCAIFSCAGLIHAWVKKKGEDIATFLTVISILASIIILSSPEEPDKLVLPIAFFIMYYIKSIRKEN